MTTSDRAAVVTNAIMQIVAGHISKISRDAALRQQLIEHLRTEFSEVAQQTRDEIRNDD